PDDDVASLEPGLGRRAILFHARNQGPVRLGELERIGEILGHVLDHYPEPAARNLALRAQLLDDRLGEVRGDRKADSHVAARLAEDRAVDADDLAFDVQQWAARIAGIDRSIRL